MALAHYEYCIDWNNDGSIDPNGDDNITAYVLKADWNYGTDNVSAVSGRWLPAKGTFTLMNWDNRFSPNNPSGPYYRNLVAKRPLRIRMQVDSGSWITMFYGYLETPLPQASDLPTQKSVSLAANGLLASLTGIQSFVPAQGSVATGYAAQLILDAAGVPSSKYTLDTGQTTVLKWILGSQDNYGLRVKGDVRAALNELEDLECGKIRETRDGKIAYEDRAHMLSSPHTVVQATYTNSPTGTLRYATIVPINTESAIINTVNVTVQNYDTYTEPGGVLWEFASGVVYLEKFTGMSHPFDFSAKFNPKMTVNAVAAAATVSVEFEVNTAQDGSGLDITASCSASATPYMDGWACRVTNNSSEQNGWLISFRIIGSNEIQRDSYTITEVDAASVTAYGEKICGINPKYIGSETEARAWAQHILALGKDMHVGVTLTFDANASTELLTEAQRMDVGDRVHIHADSNTGHFYDEDFFIAHIAHSVVTNGRHMVTVICLAAVTHSWGAVASSYTPKVYTPTSISDTQLSAVVQDAVNRATSGLTSSGMVVDPDVRDGAARATRGLDTAGYVAKEVADSRLSATASAGFARANAGLTTAGDVAREVPDHKLSVAASSGFSRATAGLTTGGRLISADYVDADGSSYVRVPPNARDGGNRGYVGLATSGDVAREVPDHKLSATASSGFARANSGLDSSGDLARNVVAGRVTPRSLTGAAGASNGVFSEYWEDAGAGWNADSLGATYPTHGLAGGKVFSLTALTSTLASSDRIPYNSSKLHRYRIRLRRTSEDGVTEHSRTHVGWSVFNSTGGFINYCWHVANFLWADEMVKDQWYEYTGWFKGTTGSPDYELSNYNDPLSPCPLGTDVAYFAPCVAVNHAAVNGTSTLEIDSITIDTVEERITTSVYTGLSSSGIIQTEVPDARLTSAASSGFYRANTGLTSGGDVASGKVVSGAIAPMAVKPSDLDPSTAPYVETFEEASERAYNCPQRDHAPTYPSNGVNGGKVLHATGPYYAITNGLYPVDKNRMYRVTGRVRRTASTTTSQTYLVGFYIYDKDIVNISAGWFYWVAGLNLKNYGINEWVEFTVYLKGEASSDFGSGTLDTPFKWKTGTAYCQPAFLLNWPGGEDHNDNESEIDSFSMLPMDEALALRLATGLGADGSVNPNQVDGDAIQSRAITAAKIAAGTITAYEIAANTITASKIYAGTISSVELAATAIDGMVITGATIRTAASGGRVEMDSVNGIRVYVTGPVLVGQFSDTGISLLGSYFQIRSAASGARVEIDGTYGVRSYDSGSVLRGQIGVDGYIKAYEVRSTDDGVKLMLGGTTAASFTEPGGGQIVFTPANASISIGGIFSAKSISICSAGYSDYVYLKMGSTTVLSATSGAVDIAGTLACDTSLTIDAVAMTSSQLTSVLNLIGHTHAYSSLSGLPTLGDAAAKNTGTGSGDVAAGNHNHDSAYAAASYFSGGTLAVGVSVASADIATTNGDVKGHKFAITGSQYVIDENGKFTGSGGIDTAGVLKGASMTLGSTTLSEAQLISLKALI